MEEIAIAILLTLFVFMFGFGVARISSDNMTIKECLQSTVVITKTKGEV